MAAFNQIVLPKTTSADDEARKKLNAHVRTGIQAAPSLTAPSNGRSIGTQVQGGARISGGRG